MSKIAMIKKDAEVTVTIGAGMIQSLQGILFLVLGTRTKEEIDEITKCIDENRQPTEPWAVNSINVVRLLTKIEEIAKETDQIVEVDESSIGDN